MGRGRRALQSSFQIVSGSATLPQSGLEADANQALAHLVPSAIIVSLGIQEPYLNEAGKSCSNRIDRRAETSSLNSYR